jgi:tungstate transport system substrate-binding protein
VLKEDYMKYLKSIIAMTAMVVLLLSLSACGVKKSIILSTTTSTNDSGLLDYLLPIFKKDTGIEVKVVAVGTGQALEIGRKGDADVLLVHAKDDELKFMQQGYGLERHDIMYNDFVLVGPKNVDNSALAGNDILKAMKAIKEKKLAFISRGDDSGTHKKELQIWKQLGLNKPKFSSYFEAGQGMGKVLTMANEKKAYTISDRATYLSMKDKLQMDIVVENDKNLYNQYGIITVNDKKFPNVNQKGADIFVKWILSDKGLNAIRQFGVDKYGQSLFIPNAKK